MILPIINKTRNTVKRLVVLSLLLLAVFQAAIAQETLRAESGLLFPDDPKGAKLPAAVPRMVDTNGNVVWIDQKFTTKAYENAARLLVLLEANRVARELHLPEKLPLNETDLIESVVTPYGFNYLHRSIGSVTTKNYCYYVSRGNMFNEADAVNYDQLCAKYRNLEKLPIQEIDTNKAYSVATQWLTAVSMDVKGLNTKCKLHIALSPFWNGLTHLGDKPNRQFVPIYFIWWTSPQNDKEGRGNVAYVEFYAPTKTLLQLSVSDPKYILRKPLKITNLDFLLPGSAPVIKLPPAQPGAQMPPG